MLDRNTHREAGRSVFTSSVTWLANFLAVGVAFLATPKVYGLTIVWVRRYTEANYGYGWTDLIEIVWFVIVAGGVFSFARASIATLVIMGGLAIAARVF